MNKLANISAISTHAPRVRRDGFRTKEYVIKRISTHAPRVRRDERRPAGAGANIHFYSRASCEARLDGQVLGDEFIISTHAPRVRRDCYESVHIVLPSNFYSRASCEARPQHYVIILQSQPISCTRRTFLSFFPQHFDEYTEDKLLFKANLPAFFESFHLRLTMFHSIMTPSGS